MSWCATCDGFFFRDKDIAVVGGGDSAMEEATFLSRFAKSVTMVHRRDQLRASKIMASRAEKDPKISFAWNSAVAEIHGDEVAGRRHADATPRPASARSWPYPACSSPSATTRARSWSGARWTPTPRATCSPTAIAPGPTCRGVFACGDLVDHTYRQAITAAGTGLPGGAGRREATWPT